MFMTEINLHIPQHDVFMQNHPRQTDLNQSKGVSIKFQVRLLKLLINGKNTDKTSLDYLSNRLEHIYQSV